MIKNPLPHILFQRQKKAKYFPLFSSELFPKKRQCLRASKLPLHRFLLLLAGATNGEENSVDNRRNSMLCNWAVGGPLCSVKLNSLCAVLDVARPGLTYVVHTDNFRREKPYFCSSKPSGIMKTESTLCNV